MNKSMFQMIAPIVAIVILGSCTRERVIEYPVFERGNGNFATRTVELNEEATVLGIHRGSRSDWSLSAKTHLEADGKQYALIEGTVFTRKEGEVVHSEALEYGKTYTREQDSVSLVFEPLHKQCKRFDFIEEEGSDFNHYGVRLDGKLYPFLLKESDYPSYPQTEPLQPIVPCYGTATVTLNMYKQDGTIDEVPMFGLNNKFSNERYLNFHGNSYSIEASSVYNMIAFGVSLPVVPIGYDQFVLMMLPGFHTTMDIDAAAVLTKSVNPRGEQIPLDKCFKFSGPIGDLQEVRVHERWIFNTFRKIADADTLWHVAQEKIAAIKSNKEYSRRQKEFGRLLIEHSYVNQYTVLASKGKCALKDKHASELRYLKDGCSFYFIGNDSPLAYAYANDIKGEVTEWMEGYRRARRLSKRMLQMEVMPEEAFDTIPELFHAELKCLNDSAKVAVERLSAQNKKSIIKDTPSCSGEEFVSRVVSECPGKVVFFDFWATWCAPCKKGINEMEGAKKKYEGKPVVFVYVTNESSPSATWVRETDSMHGIHYRLPNTMWKDIKELNGGGIPHYLIFDRHGKKVLDNTGYSTGLYKDFFEEIDKLLL